MGYSFVVKSQINQIEKGGHMEEKEKSCRILIQGGSGEIIEKKSRFIATIRSVESEKEATEFIDEMKKRYWDATHNCSAFVIGDKVPLTRCSDDGEPSGTAGRPMLEVLLGEELCNAAVVVTRYFGGTLLGTGGLVRAYTAAVKEGLKNCETGRLRAGSIISVETDYNGIGKILYLMGQMGLEALESDYSDVVRLSVRVPAEEASDFMDEVTQATAGRARMSVSETLNYIDKE